MKGFADRWDSDLAGIKEEPENNVEAYLHLAVKHAVDSTSWVNGGSLPRLQHAEGQKTMHFF